MLVIMVSFTLVKALQKEKPDIIHAHSPVLNYFPAWLFGRVFKMPVLYEIRAYWEDAGVDNGTYEVASLKYKLVKWLETWTCRQVDHIAVLCNGIRMDLAKRGIGLEKMTPVYNGINPENFVPCAPAVKLVEKWGLQDRKVIGFVGSFYHYEGLSFLVEAFGRIVLNNPDYVLLLVGGGDMERELKQQVEDLGIAKNVIMPGRVPHHLVRKVYAMIDLLVYPRHDIRLTELVTPLKPLEAMAMGKALIASDIAGHRELITHNLTGVLFPAGDVEALALEIVSLIKDGHRLRRIGAVGRQFVLKNKTWQKTTSVYPSIYAKIIRGMKTPEKLKRKV